MATYTDDEKRVYKQFRSELSQIVEVIQVCIKKKQRDEAYRWLAELLTMEKTWKWTAANPGVVLTDEHFSRKPVVLKDSEPTRQGALKRLEILVDVIKAARRELEIAQW